ncbi:MAG TPA: ABC transporter, partial [Ruminococcaceae bacterium]|nr:ABC transporter [Oscillospiraceae bacterium]
LVDECRHDLDSLEIVSGTMDDAFIAITGKEIRE